MHRHLTFAIVLSCLALASHSQSSHTLHSPISNSDANSAMQDIIKKSSRGALPVGQREQPITIKTAAGKGITTVACGLVSELTLMHRSNEPGMMASVIMAISTGKPVVLKDVKCLGSGKAAASTAALIPDAPPPLSQAERCKLPLAKGRMQGC